MKTRVVLLTFLLLFAASNNYAEQARPGATAPDYRTFSSQLGTLKEKVLQLSQELKKLENELLFPASTKIVVFLSIPENSNLDLQSVQLQFDDKVVRSHLYSSRELEALRKGGVHQVYLGNLTEGTHILKASVMGQDAGGKDYRQDAILKIDKETVSKFIELKFISVTENEQPQFIAKEW